MNCSTAEAIELFFSKDTLSAKEYKFVQKNLKPNTIRMRYRGHCYILVIEISEEGKDIAIYTKIEGLHLRALTTRSLRDAPGSGKYVFAIMGTDGAIHQDYYQRLTKSKSYKSLTSKVTKTSHFRAVVKELNNRIHLARDINTMFIHLDEILR